MASAPLTAALGAPLWVSAQAPANEPAPASAPPLAPPRPLTVALLLPAQNTPFARAAETLRLGFMAARAAAAPEATVQVLEIDERPEQLARAFAAARSGGAQVLAGPLTRTQVNATLRTDPGLPVVTLALPDHDALAAPSLLAFGIGIEQEARAVAAAALAALARPADSPTPLAPRFVLLTGEGALARRASAAFAAALREAGERVTALNFSHRYETLQAIGDRVFRAQPEAVFVAADAREAAMLRPRLPPGGLLYGTSLLNVGGAEGQLLAADLNGLRFADMPWLLEPDHAAVMVFARPAQPLSAELNRVYALGIDGFRLALEWAAGRSRFTLDGVTGALAVDRAVSARVQRRPAFGVFRHGAVERLAEARLAEPLG